MSQKSFLSLKELALFAGRLAGITKDYGLSCGNRVCIATGIEYNMTIYTTDSIWNETKNTCPAMKDADIRLIKIMQ
ncbi:MAG: hypothetical protein SFT93_00070 [Rickettsiaceae bacterium]|nr:hypothetical protein [Rickettsiaceae bacterium]